MVKVVKLLGRQYRLSLEADEMKDNPPYNAFEVKTRENLKKGDVLLVVEDEE